MATPTEGRQQLAPTASAPHQLPSLNLQPGTPARHHSGRSSRPSFSEKPVQDGGSSSPRPKSYSLSSNGNTRVSSVAGLDAEDGSAHRAVRTLPSWVRSYEVEDEDANPSQRLLPYPAATQVAQHNHSPAPKHKAEPGRLHDHERESTPVTSNPPTREHASKWKNFMLVSALPQGPAGEGEKVNDEWMRDHMPDLEAPWHPDRRGMGGPQEDGTLLTSQLKRVKLWDGFLRALVRDPMVPLVFRLIIWFFSSCAVALGCSIFMLSKRYKFSESPSTLMAIIFDTIALVYGFFITYDEYSGKPLGLRSPAAKMRLVLLDLFFIVFNSANLSLAFDSLSDTRGFCAARPAHEPDLAQLGVQNFVLCDRQRALAGVLLIALVAWLLTFSVSLFRLVERVNRD